MEKFARIANFEMLSDADSKKLLGGLDDGGDDGTKVTVSCTVVTTTANCTCNNGVSDSCTDSGQGSECVPDPPPHQD